MDVHSLVKRCLPDNAKIKLDRGKGLYRVRVSPVEGEKCVKNLSNNGFLATLDGEFLTATPSRAIIESQAAEIKRLDLDDHLYTSLKRLAGRGICEGETALFVKALKGRLYDAATIEDRLRRQAAECMRAGCGGLLSAIRYVSIIDKEANI